MNQSNKLTIEEINSVKGLGFLRDKTTDDCFNARVITRNGKISANEIEIIAKAAKLYGNGEVAMTSRMTIEIQKVAFNNIKPLICFLNENGLETGGTGPKVRPIVSCKGTTCQYGLIDTFKLSEEIHNVFYKGYHNIKLPHKFKIAIGGCPNNCVKPDLNDLGIIGQKVFNINTNKCKGCKKCQVESSCPMKAAFLEKDVIKIDETICNNCGRCMNKCPFGVFEDFSEAYKVYVGGRWGKKVARGDAINKLLTSKEEVLSIIEKTILWYKEQGIQGERLNDTINRIGFDKFQNQILSDDILLRKDQICNQE